MDKRYLFRGRNMESGEWAIGNYVHRPDPLITGTDYHKITWNKNGVEFWERVDPITIGQSTGLIAHKSYRGESEEERLLYDGDIVYIPDWQCYSQVYWYQGAWMLKFEGCDEYLYDVADMCEILGTIHEHPEMLGEEEGTC